MRPDFALGVTVFRLATDYVEGRALDGVEVDLDHVFTQMYDALLPLDAAEREVRLAQTERVMYLPTAH